MQPIFPLIFLLILLFLIILLPAYKHILNIIDNVFTAILCKEIIDKKEKLSKIEYAILIRHMEWKGFFLLRKLLLKKNGANVLEIFAKASKNDASSALYGMTYFKYRDGFHPPGKSIKAVSTTLGFVTDMPVPHNAAPGFLVAIRNILLAAPNLFEMAQNIIIGKAQDWNDPNLILDFAIVCEDMDISYRQLYLAISKYKNDIRYRFEQRFSVYPEVEKLITLSE